MNNIFEIIIKLKNINMNEMNDDVSVMLNYFRMSNEKLILDYTRLLIWHVYVLFKKTLTWKINIL